MKKSTRNLLIMLVVLVVLGGLAAIIYLYEPAAEEEVSSSSEIEDTSIELINKESTDIASISIKNKDSEYTLSPKEITSEDESTIDFSIDGFESYDILTSNVNTMASTLYSMTASKSIGEQEKLADFGLDGDGEAKAVIKYKDGSSDTLVIGTAAGESTGRYVLKDGEIYIVSSISDNIFSSPYVFFNLDVISIADRVEETAEESESSIVEEESSETTETLEDLLYTMTLSGTEFANSISVKYAPTSIMTYSMTEPMVGDGASTKISEIITALKKVSASGVVYAGNEEDKLAEYGLSEPAAQVQYKLNTEEHVIKLSAANSDGIRYMLVDDSNIIYTIANSTVSIWAEAKVMDLRSPYIALPNIKEIETLTLNLNGEETVFSGTLIKDEENSTEDSVSYNLEVECSGNAIDYEIYQPFYKELISIALLSFDEAAYDAENPYFTINYKYFDNSSEEITVKFFKLEDSDRYAVELNGSYSGVVRKNSLDNVTALIDDVKNNVSAETE